MEPPDFPLTTSFRVAHFIGRVRSNDLRLIRDIQRVFSASAGEDEPASTTYTVFVERRLTPSRRHWASRDGVVIRISGFYPSLIEAIESDVYRSLKAMPRDLCLVDAGAVGVQGRGILVMGVDQAVRNRLILDLVEAGAQFVADGLTLIRGDSLMTFPKAIALQRPKHPMARRHLREAEGSLGYATVYHSPPSTGPIPECYPLGGIAILSGTDPHGPRFERIPRAEALAIVMSRTSRHPDGDEFVLDRLQALTEGASCFRFWMSGRRATIQAVFECFQPPATHQDARSTPQPQ